MRHQVAKHGHNAGMAGSIVGARSDRAQSSAVALENEPGVRYVLALGAIEEPELLTAVDRVVSGIAPFPVVRNSPCFPNNFVRKRGRRAVTFLTVRVG